MAGTAEKTKPELWDRVKHQVTKSDKGGRPGQWSARKAQLAVAEYKKEGGGYRGRKSADNPLSQWTREKWGTKSGRKSTETGERYLPEQARTSLSDREYAETSAKKRRDARAGKQFSRQPAPIARKTARHRDTGRGGATKVELMDQARRRGIAGRSRMTKAELERALSA